MAADDKTAGRVSLTTADHDTAKGDYIHVKAIGNEIPNMYNLKGNTPHGTEAPTYLEHCGPCPVCCTHEHCKEPREKPNSKVTTPGG